jgi:hypothetical protein
VGLAVRKDGDEIERCAASAVGAASEGLITFFAARDVEEIVLKPHDRVIFSSPIGFERKRYSDPCPEADFSPTIERRLKLYSPVSQALGKRIT